MRNCSYGLWLTISLGVVLALQEMLLAQVGPSDPPLPLLPADNFTVEIARYFGKSITLRTASSTDQPPEPVEVAQLPPGASRGAPANRSRSPFTSSARRSVSSAATAGFGGRRGSRTRTPNVIGDFFGGGSRSVFIDNIVGVDLHVPGNILVGSPGSADAIPSSGPHRPQSAVRRRRW